MMKENVRNALLAMMANSAVHLSAQTFLHNAICSLTSPTILDTSFWVIGKPYLTIIASNEEIIPGSSLLRSKLFR